MAKKTNEDDKKTKLIAMSVILGVFVLISVVAFLVLPPGEKPKVPDNMDPTKTNPTAGSENEKDTTNSSTEKGDTMTGKVTAVIDVKDYGTITLELDADQAPITVTNFVNLAESGFYNGLTFHRIMEGFMMQGGDPLGNGSGGSDENIKGEFSDNGVDNRLSHTRGAISMARAGNPYNPASAYNTASSQFFICHQDADFLDGQYACFGYVTEGIEVVDAVCESSNPIDDNGTIPSEEQPIINSVTIER